MVYVDGFNLYNAMHDLFGRSTLWLDLARLAESFRPHQQLIKVKYFTAPVLGEPEAQGRQAHYQAALKARYGERIEVVQGRYQRKQKKCFNCGATHDHYEEKETDVNIAVALVSDAAHKNMDTALLISGDSDLVPAARAAMKINPRLFVAAAFPPRRVSKHLRSLMPSSFVIAKNKFKNMQLPDTFTVNGTQYTRPSKWT